MCNVISNMLHYITYYIMLLLPWNPTSLHTLLLLLKGYVTCHHNTQKTLITNTTTFHHIYTQQHIMIILNIILINTTQHRNIISFRRYVTLHIGITSMTYRAVACAGARDLASDRCVARRPAC